MGSLPLPIVCSSYARPIPRRSSVVFLASPVSLGYFRFLRWRTVDHGLLLISERKICTSQHRTLRWRQRGVAACLSLGAADLAKVFRFNELLGWTTRAMTEAEVKFIEQELSIQ